MRRREFIAGLGSAAAWPVVARAQQPAMPAVGLLLARSAGDALSVGDSAAFRQGLAEAGYVEGSSIAIEARFAGGQLDRLPILAAELVRRQVAVIFASGSDAAQAAKYATTTIPIIFQIGNDPVQTGLVASFNRPGGNITGVTALSREIQGKRLTMARELLPNASIIATFSNPVSVVSDINLRDLEAAAASIGQQLLVLRASTDRELEAAFISMVQQGASALFVNGSPFFGDRRDLIVALAARHRIPTIFPRREPVAAGGLMSYGTNTADLVRQAGIYTARILKGEKPADLPIFQPTKFEFVINLKTAKALGLTIPETLLATADEVIQK
jgi:putative tryptophan/tyrosine transport system substrate-binding protein